MDNPYVGAAAGFAGDAASALGSGLRFVTALRDAAEQQKQRQYAQAMSEQGTLAQRLNEGWQLYQPSQNVTKEASGLKRRDYQPAPAGLITLPTLGVQLYRPEQTAKEKQAQQQQSYSDLQTALQHGGTPVDQNGNTWQMSTTPRFQMDEQGGMTPAGAGIHAAPPDASRVVSIPGAGQVYMPTQDETLSAKLNTEAQARAPRTRIDTENFSAPVLIDEESGDVKPLKMAPGVTHTGKPAAEKWSYGQETDEQGRMTVVRKGEAGAQMWGGPEKGWVPMAAGAAIGPKRRDSDAEARADRFREREEDKKQRGIDDAQKRIDLLQQQEQKLHGLREALGDAIAVPDNEKFVDPITGREMQMSAARRKYYQERLDGASKQVEALQDQQKKLIQRRGGAPQQQQVAGVDAVRAYAQRKGIGVADAIREFQAAGFTVAR